MAQNQRSFYFPSKYSADVIMENVEKQISANYDLQQRLLENAHAFQFQIENKRKQFEAEKLKYQLEANVDLQYSLQTNSFNFQSQLEKSRQKFELTRIKLQYFMQLETQAHQAKENQ